MLLRKIFGSLVLASAVIGSTVSIVAVGEETPQLQPSAKSDGTSSTATKDAAAPTATPLPIAGPPEAPPPAGTGEEADVFTETMLTTTIAYLNQGYMSIGILADAIAAGAYEEEQARALLEAHEALAEQVEAQLRTLAKSPGLDQEDVAAVNELVKLAQLNTLQCTTLAAVFEGNDSQDAVWEKIRAAALKELEKYGEDEAPETAADAKPTVTK